VVPDLEPYLSGGTIEMFPAREWYLERGKLELQRVTRAWNDICWGRGRGDTLECGQRLAGASSSAFAASHCPP
jgi:hypothetical protein